MTLKQLKKLVQSYIDQAGDSDWGEKKRYKVNEYVEIDDQVEQASVSSHLRWMLHEMVDMSDVGKLNRWVGFVQGVLWVMGYRTINELRQEVMQCRENKR